MTKDFPAGLMFLAFGLTALYFGRHLAVGTGVRMGPGYGPRARLHPHGPGRHHLRLRPGERQRAFVLLFERAGILPALVALVAISFVANEEFKIVEVIGNMVVLTALCIIFKLGLGINI